MLKKAVIALILSSIYLFGQRVEIDVNISPKYEIYAKNLSVDEKNITTSGGSLLLNSGFYIEANSARLDRESSILELKGDVKIYKDDNLALLSEEVYLNLLTKDGTFKPFYVQESESSIWVFSKSASFEKERYSFGEVATSSCSISKPLWHFEATKGHLDTTSKWLHLSHPKLYIYETPILYLPYFIIPTNRDRRSGLLIPKIAISENDGLMYMQPIYYAPKENFDIEFRPQIMTNRGMGISGELRFVDTLYSSGSINVGYYKDQSSYKKQVVLKHNAHYGYGGKYKNSAILSRYFDLVDRDGLFIDALFLNGIDYLNIQDFETLKSYKERTVTSKLNYHILSDNNFYGLYMRYFIDTSKQSNSDTMQNIPSLNYHRFKESLFFDRLIYSLDFNFNNYIRKEGFIAREYEFEAPFSYYYPIFENYLNLGAKKSFHFLHVDYENLEDGKDSSFLRSSYELILSSDLVKNYKNYRHFLNLEASYLKSYMRSKKGYFTNFSSVPEDSERFRISSQNYLYDKDANLLLYLRLKNDIFLSDDKKNYSTTSSELGAYLNKTTTLNFDTLYSSKTKRFEEVKTYLDYDGDDYRFLFGHFYRDTFEDKKDSYMISEAQIKGVDYTFYGSVGYDYKDNKFRNYEVGVRNKKSCFYYDLSFKKNLTPVMTATGSSSIDESFVYLEFRFLPLGGLSYKLLDKQKDEDEF